MKKKEKFEKLEHFVKSVATTRFLLKRANDQGSLLEGLVLYNSLADALCRICLVLKQQLESKTDDFKVEYIYQSSDSHISERKIFELVKDKDIIPDDLYSELNDLYDIRNKGIHRFSITDIKYSHLEIVLERYELVVQRLKNIIYKLESEQVSTGIGMTVSGNGDKNDDEREMAKGIMKKIFHDSEIDLADTLNASGDFSEEEKRQKVRDDIREEIEISKELKNIPNEATSIKDVSKWAERKGLLKICNCGHSKIRHIDTDNLHKDTTLKEQVNRCQAEGCDCEFFEEDPSKSLLSEK